MKDAHERAGIWSDVCGLLERHGIAPETVSITIGEPMAPTDEDGEPIHGPAFKPVAINVEGWL